MPELDLGSVIGPQGPKGDKGIDGAVGPMGPQGEKGDDGAAASINGVNALTMTTGDGLEATMNGSAYHLKLTDKALNAVQAVPTFTRPNLLDNWYFGRPVDQRGGYVVYAGANLYSDASCTTIAGQVAGGPYAARAISDICVSFTSNATYYCKIGDTGVVRGYTGNGYTVDRWIADNHQITISNGILISSASFFYQKLAQSTMDALNGKQITFSALTTSNSFLTGSWVVDNTIQSDTRIAENNEFILFRSPWTGTGLGIYAKTATNFIAAKLEIGPTQTLAHQENGVWVMNEVPEYGEQLRRCQMDLFKIGDAVRYCSIGNGVARDGQFVSITIPTPVTMRTMPVLIAPPVGFTMRHNDTIVSGGANFIEDAFSQNSIMLKVQSQVALTPGDMWEAFLQPGGSLVFSAEL